MTRLTWGSAGQRFYETGVDRGVLYPNSLEGFAWNGLTSVQETPSGGTAQPFYYDGFKYINLASATEFEATIEAFSAPTEFDAADGVLSIANGLFVTEQPRRPFSFSYRTGVGNDLDGVDHGYKVHVVYNALARPASREHGSISESVDPTKFSWNITTTPPYIPGFRPTAHFVVDSRKTAPDLLDILEEQLYGSAMTDPFLPTPTALIELFRIGTP